MVEDHKTISQKTAGVFSAFRRDKRGVVGFIFAFSMIPIFGFVGMATDMANVGREQQSLQAAMDAAAVAGTKLATTNMTAAVAEAQRVLEANLTPGQRNYPILITAADAGRGLDIRTSTGAAMDMTFLRAVGMPRWTLNVRATALATVNTTITARAPEVAQLDPEAGDYNRFYVYCFDRNRINQPDMGRTQMTAIADNAGTSFQYTMPMCKTNETMSYRLMNVRNARTKPWLWDTSPPGTLFLTENRPNEWGENVTFNYFTDTEVLNGVPRWNFPNNIPILETVMCNSLAECKPQSQGGVIPEGRNRTPQANSQACGQGKYIFFGWEDRPPGYGWTDRDYDDIRVIIECPRVDTTTSISVRLVR